MENVADSVDSGNLLPIAQKFRQLHTILTKVREYFLKNEEEHLHTPFPLIVKELQPHIIEWRRECENLKRLIQQNSTITRDPEMKKLVHNVNESALQDRINHTIREIEERRARLLKGIKRASDGSIKIGELQSEVACFPNQFGQISGDIHNHLVLPQRQILHERNNPNTHSPLHSLLNNIPLKYPPMSKSRQLVTSKPKDETRNLTFTQQPFSQGMTLTASHSNSNPDIIVIDDDDDVIVVDRATFEKAAQRNRGLSSHAMDTNTEDLQKNIHIREGSVSSAEEDFQEYDDISDDESIFYYKISEEIQRYTRNQSAPVETFIASEIGQRRQNSRVLVEALDCLKERTLEELSKSFAFEIKPNFNNILRELKNEQMLLARHIDLNRKGKKSINAGPTRYTGYIPAWYRDFSNSHNLHLVHQPFDEEETRRLLQTMDKLLKRGMSTLDWPQICACLSHRSAEECKAFFWDMLEEYERSKLSKNLAVGKDMQHIPPRKTRIFQDLTEGLKPRSIIPIREHTLQNLQMLTEIKESSGDNIEFSFNKDNTKLVIASSTVDEEQSNRRGNLILADLQRGVIRYLDGHRVGSMHSTVTNAKFGGCNEFIVSASLDKTIKLWSTDGSPRHTLRNKHNGRINQLAIKQDNDNLVGASGSDDGLFVLWRINPMGSKVFLQANWELQIRNRSISTVKFGINTSKETIFTGIEGRYQQGEGLLKSWDIETQIERSNYPLPRGVADFAVASTGDMCVCGTTYGERDTERRGDCQLSLFESHNGYLQYKMGFKHDQNDTNIVTISPCGKFITSSGTNNSTWVFDIRYNIRPLHILNHINDARLQPTIVEDDGVNGAQWASASNFIFTGGSDSMVHLWNIALANPLISTYRQPGPVCSLKLSGDNSVLAVGTTGGVTRLYGNGVLWRDLSTWQVESYTPGEEIWRIEYNEGF